MNVRNGAGIISALSVVVSARKEGRKTGIRNGNRRDLEQVDGKAEKLLNHKRHYLLINGAGLFGLAFGWTSTSTRILAPERPCGLNSKNGRWLGKTFRMYQGK